MSSTSPPEQRETLAGHPRAGRKKGFFSSWKMVALLLLVFGLIVVILNYVMTARLAGDYVAGSDPEGSVRMRMNPLPIFADRYELKQPNYTGSFARWGAGGSFHVYGMTLTDHTWKGPGGQPSHTTFGFIPRQLYVPMDGPGELYVRDPNRGTGVGEVIIEKFPSGTVVAFEEAYWDQDAPAMLVAAERMLQAVPESMIARFWYLESLILDGDAPRASAEFAPWEADFEADPSGRGPVFAAMLRHDLKYADPKYDELHQRQRDVGYFGMLTAPGLVPAADYEATLRFVRDSAVSGIARPPVLHSESFYFTLTQVVVGMACTEAMFAAVRGEHDEAHLLLMGALETANPRRPAHDYFEGAVDLSIRDRMAHTLTEYYINGVHSAEQLEERWTDLNDRIGQLSDPSLLGSWLVQLKGVGAHRYVSGELFYRARFAAVRLQLFRAAYRVRHYRAVTGEWPTVDSINLSDIELLLPSDLPARDYFGEGDSATLRWRLDGDDLVLYSLGPDGDDDAAALELDPRNGADSDGDISVRLTPRPRYDWPSEPGYLYEDYADFDRRYPGGELPEDPFNRYEASLPLRLARDHSHRVWSFGPDIYTEYKDLAPTYVGRAFEPHYDPTNGTTSEGDLWMELPLRPDAQLPPAVTPAPTPTPVSGWAP